MTIFNSFFVCLPEGMGITLAISSISCWTYLINRKTNHFGYFGKQGPRTAVPVWLFGSEQSDAWKAVLGAAAQRGMASGEHQISWSPCGVGGFLWSLFFGLWTNQPTNKSKVQYFTYIFNPSFLMFFQLGERTVPENYRKPWGVAMGLFVPTFRCSQSLLGLKATSDNLYSIDHGLWQ